MKKRTKKIRTISTNNSDKILRISILFFVLTFLARLYFSANLTTKSIQLKELYAQKVELEQDVAKLTYQELSLSSLDDVKSRAEKNGFVVNDKLLLSLDLTVSAPLASR